MKTFLMALLKCRYPVGLETKWLKPATSLPTKTLRSLYSRWLLRAYAFHNNTQKEMLSTSRLFIAYDGALSCPGRDSEEAMDLFIDRMDESVSYWCGKVSPRVEINIAFNDPEKFPYQYVKWKTRVTKYNVRRYVNENYTWISFSVLLVLMNILSLLIINL